MGTAGNTKVAARYAKAVIETFLNGKGSESTALVNKIVRELENFSSVIESNAELSSALLTDLFSEPEREAIVEDISAKLKLSPETKRILKVVSESKRLKVTRSIAEKIHLLLLESAGVVPIQVLSAGELGPDERKKVETKFKKVFGKEVEASYQVEPSLMGGLRVTAAGKTYDGSVSGWLETIEEKLVGGRI
jgi:F-type H+-transporting ATPase subunit delta